MDNVVIYSITWSEHLETLSEVLSRFRDASLTLNTSKSEFGKATMTYLGKQVGQMRPIAAKMQAIIDFPVPQTKKICLDFWECVVFIVDFAEIFQMWLVH